MDWRKGAEQLREWVATIPAPAWPFIFGAILVVAGWVTGAVQLTTRMGWPYQLSVYLGLAVLILICGLLLAAWYRDRPLRGPAWTRRFNEIYAEQHALWDTVQPDTRSEMPPEIQKRVERLRRHVYRLFAYEEAHQLMALPEMQRSRAMKSGDWRAATLAYLGAIANVLHAAWEAHAGHPFARSHDPLTDHSHDTP